MKLFEDALSIPTEEIELELCGFGLIPWSSFLLNPRRLRGSDFLMRWSQGQWSEERIIQAVEETGKYFALPYGPSGAAPDSNVREFELYFERLEKAGLGKLKRPDLLIFHKSDEAIVKKLIEKLKGITELPFTSEEDSDMRSLLNKSILAIECENSLWCAKKMPDFGSELTPQKRLGGKDGLKRTAVVPTVIIKEEDRMPLRDWQSKQGIKIHVWHVFYDLAFGLSLEKAELLIKEGRIEPTIQIFQAPGGATTKKVIYKFYYHHAYALGIAKEDAQLVADHIIDKNGHILPYVKFKGGKLELTSDALNELNKIASEK